MAQVRRDSYSWKLHMRYKKGTGGILVGQCLDIPIITVRGKDPDELVQRIYHDIDVYFTTFPDKAEAFLEKNGTLVRSKVVGIQDHAVSVMPPARVEWQEQELVCTSVT